MSVSPPTQRTEKRKKAIGKRHYFTDGMCLYFLRDVLPEGDFFLVENCMTNQARWITRDKYEEIAQRRVEFST